MTDNDAIIRTAQVMEALIFASAEPVAERVLAKHLPEGTTLHDVLTVIATRYGEDSGIELKHVGQGWAFRTKAEVAALLNIEKETERPLSRAALEVVAIIAYHQPITRAEIEEIRGVSISRGTMDILLELGWIKPRGRRRTPGRPLTWGTTDGFLDHFGLDDINALPGLDELKQAGLLRVGQSISDRNGLSSLFNGGEDDAEEDGENTSFDEDELLNFDEPLDEGGIDIHADDA
ncbi:MAG: SMC-Scp complex subunit ScpB [Alphaproteobacteria bacterium]|nr:SMC-Scp complex subunit ScpB [Alphaproteobacteria bacterium]